MSDIFEEVEEGLAQDKLSSAWKKWWPYIVGVCVLVVGLVAADSISKSLRASKIETAGVSFENGLLALEAQDIVKARSEFDVALNSSTGFSRLAANMLADGEIRFAGDSDKAQSLLETAGQSEGPLAKLSLLKAAYIMSDNASLAEVEAFVEPLLSAETGFANLARELIASKALVEGDFERARREFTVLSLSLESADTPQGVAERARRALAVIPALEAAETPASPIEEQDESAAEVIPEADITASDASVEE